MTPDLADLGAFLETGKSPKYSQEQILGRWNFDPRAALISVRRAKPNISWSEMQRVKQWMQTTFSKTSLIAMPDHHVILKNVPQLGQASAPGAALQTLQGQWTALLESKYQISVNSQDLAGVVEGERLTIKWTGTDLVFERQD